MQSVFYEAPSMDKFPGKAQQDFAAFLEKQLSQVLKTAIRISCDCFRTSEFNNASQYPVDEKQEDIVDQALWSVVQIRGDYNRAFALREMARDLNEKQLPLALEMARGIADDHARSAALSGLARHLGQEQRQNIICEALKAANKIDDHYIRVTALNSIAQSLSEEQRRGVIDDALTAASQIDDDYTRVAALSCIARYLSQEQLDRACDTAREISSDDARASALSCIARYLTKKQRLEFLAEVVRTGNTHWSFPRQLASSATLQPNH